MKKLLTGFLSLFLVLTLVPVSAGIFAEEAKAPKTVKVNFVDGVTQNVAGGFTITGDDFNFIPEDVIPEYAKEGYELEAWKTVENNKVFNKGQKVTTADFKEFYVADDGVVYVTFEPVWKEIKPQTKLTKVVVNFADGVTQNVAGGFTITGDDFNFIPKHVMPEFEKADHTLVGWKSLDTGKTFALEKKVTLKDFEGVTTDKDGVAHVTLDAVWEKVEPKELNKIIIKFLEGEKEVAGTITIDKNNPNNQFYNAVYKDAEKEGYKLTGWSIDGNFFKAGQNFNIMNVLVIVGDNYDKTTGEATLVATPVWEKVKPQGQVYVSEVTLKFLEDKEGVQKEVAAEIVFNKDHQHNYLYDSVYPAFEKEGYKLTNWKINGQLFKAGQEIHNKDIVMLVGDNFDKDGKAVLVAYPVFTKLNSELNTITVKYLEDKIGPQEEVAAGNDVVEGDFTLAAGSVYKKFEKAGYTLAGWKFGDKFFKAGEKIEFAKLAELVGDNYDKDGKAVIAFTPVFEKIPAPQKPVNPSQPVAPQGRPNVNTGVNF